MNQLITVNQADIGGDSVQSVDARELHSFLEVGKDFSTWMKDRVEQYGFVQGADFDVFTDLGENPQGGRPAKEYSITLNMAKELSMVERNEKGKQARKYFIECERRLHSGNHEARNISVDVSDLDRIAHAKSSGVISPTEARDAALLALGVELPKPQKKTVTPEPRYETAFHDNYAGELISAQNLEYFANVAYGSAARMMVKHRLAYSLDLGHSGKRKLSRLVLTPAGRKIAVQNGTTFIRFKRDPAIRWLRSVAPQLRY